MNERQLELVSTTNVSRDRLCTAANGGPRTHTSQTLTAQESHDYLKLFELNVYRTQQPPKKRYSARQTLDTLWTLRSRTSNASAVRCAFANWRVVVNMRQSAEYVFVKQMQNLAARVVQGWRVAVQSHKARAQYGSFFSHKLCTAILRTAWKTWWMVIYRRTAAMGLMRRILFVPVNLPQVFTSWSRCCVGRSKKRDSMMNVTARFITGVERTSISIKMTFFAWKTACHWNSKMRGIACHAAKRNARVLVKVLHRLSCALAFRAIKSRMCSDQSEQFEVENCSLHAHAHVREWHSARHCLRTFFVMWKKEIRLSKMNFALEPMCDTATRSSPLLAFSFRLWRVATSLHSRQKLSFMRVPRSMMMAIQSERLDAHVKVLRAVSALRTSRLLRTTFNQWFLCVLRHKQDVQHTKVDQSHVRRKSIKNSFLFDKMRSAPSWMDALILVRCLYCWSSLCATEKTVRRTSIETTQLPTICDQNSSVLVDDKKEDVGFKVQNFRAVTSRAKQKGGKESGFDEERRSQRQPQQSGQAKETDRRSKVDRVSAQCQSVKPISQEQHKKGKNHWHNVTKGEAHEVASTDELAKNVAWQDDLQKLAAYALHEQELQHRDTLYALPIEHPLAPPSLDITKPKSVKKYCASGDPKTDTAPSKVSETLHSRPRSPNAHRHSQPTLRTSAQKSQRSDVSRSPAPQQGRNEANSASVRKLLEHYGLPLDGDPIASTVALMGRPNPDGTCVLPSSSSSHSRSLGRSGSQAVSPPRFAADQPAGNSEIRVCRSSPERVVCAGEVSSNAEAGLIDNILQNVPALGSRDWSVKKSSLKNNAWETNREDSHANDKRCLSGSASFANSSRPLEQFEMEDSPKETTDVLLPCASSKVCDTHAVGGAQIGNGTGHVTVLESAPPSSSPIAQLSVNDLGANTAVKNSRDNVDGPLLASSLAPTVRAELCAPHSAKTENAKPHYKEEAGDARCAGSGDARCAGSGDARCAGSGDARCAGSDGVSRNGSMPKTGSSATSTSKSVSFPLLADSTPVVANALNTCVVPNPLAGTDHTAGAPDLNMPTSMQHLEAAKMMLRDGPVSPRLREMGVVSCPPAGHVSSSTDPHAATRALCPHQQSSLAGDMPLRTSPRVQASNGSFGYPVCGGMLSADRAPAPLGTKPDVAVRPTSGQEQPSCAKKTLDGAPSCASTYHVPCSRHHSPSGSGHSIRRAASPHHASVAPSTTSIAASDAAPLASTSTHRMGMTTLAMASNHFSDAPPSVPAARDFPSPSRPDATTPPKPPSLARARIRGNMCNSVDILPWASEVVCGTTSGTFALPRKSGQFLKFPADESLIAAPPDATLNAVSRQFPVLTSSSPVVSATTGPDTRVCVRANGDTFALTVGKDATPRCSRRDLCSSNPVDEEKEFVQSGSKSGTRQKLGKLELPEFHGQFPGDPPAELEDKQNNGRDDSAVSIAMPSPWNVEVPAPDPLDLIRDPTTLGIPPNPWLPEPEKTTSSFNVTLRDAVPAPSSVYPTPLDESVSGMLPSSCEYEESLLFPGTEPLHEDDVRSVVPSLPTDVLTWDDGGRAAATSPAEKIMPAQQERGNVVTRSFTTGSAADVPYPGYVDEYSYQDVEEQNRIYYALERPKALPENVYWHENNKDSGNCPTSKSRQGSAHHRLRCEDDKSMTRRSRDYFDEHSSSSSTKLCTRRDDKEYTGSSTSHARRQMVENIEIHAATAKARSSFYSPTNTRTNEHVAYYVPHNERRECATSPPRPQNNAEYEGHYSSTPQSPQTASYRTSSTTWSPRGVMRTPPLPSSKPNNWEAESTRRELQKETPPLPTHKQKNWETESAAREPQKEKASCPSRKLNYREAESAAHRTPSWHVGDATTWTTDKKENVFSHPEAELARAEWKRSTKFPRYGSGGWESGGWGGCGSGKPAQYPSWERQGERTSSAEKRDTKRDNWGEQWWRGWWASDWVGGNWTQG